MQDFNVWEQRARELKEAGRPGDALKIYLVMAGGDPSLDAGYLGLRIGECYEKLGDPHSARFWYGRAVEENPTIDRYIAARARLEHLSIDDVLAPGPTVMARRAG